MLTITLLLVVAAFVLCIASAMGKAPLWPAVLVTILAVAVQVIPVK